MSSIYSWPLNGRNEKEEEQQEGTHEGQMCILFLLAGYYKAEHTLGGLSGWFLIFITTILKGKSKKILVAARLF
jgi:hypothetical protein